MTKMDTSLRQKYFKRMPSNEAMIQNLIRRVGIIKIDQIPALFGLNEAEKQSCYYYLLDLINRKDRIMVTDDEYVVTFAKKNPDRDVAECMWDVIEKKNSIELDTVEKGESPANIFYLDKDGCTNIVTFIDKNKIGNVIYLQERCFARHIVGKKDGEYVDMDVLKLVFVVHDMEVAETIANTISLQLPCEFCHVDHTKLDQNGFPTVEYYEL